jgi:hypothetical protein
VDAFQKAIEIDPEFGWPYSNLALTLPLKAGMRKPSLISEASKCLTADKDKAMTGTAWKCLSQIEPV